MKNLQHKTALITGATSGIGKAIALLMAPKGCNLVCVGRNRKGLELLKREMPENISFCSYECDMADEEKVLQVSQRIVAECGKIDILIHSAGSITINPVITSTLEEYNSIFGLNVKAPFLITKLFLPLLKENRGQIVFINSSAIQRAIPNASLYSASKFALKGFADCLRQEVNRFGVRVISVFPGQTDTPMQKKLYENGNKKYIPENLIQSADVASLVIHGLEMPETAEVTDLYVRPMISYIQNKI